MNDVKPRKTIYTMYIKRLLDIILSSIAIVVLSPVFIIVAVLEIIYHGRPILYSQERPGRDGKIFRIYKFRSMTNEVDEHGELLPEDRRVTRFGRAIRRLSIDELPELFCILRGDMSIIGPRPLLVEYLPYYKGKHVARHSIRPGFACIPLRKVSEWSWHTQFDNDIWYIEHCSLLVDVLEVFAVIREAIAAAEYRVSGIREDFFESYVDEASE